MEGRQDPFYYIPSIVELEKKIRQISSLRLRDFILAMSSGATPSVKEEEKFYSDEVNGVPFIRVQNLSPTNELMLNDLRYINHETHRKYLNRSQVKGGDLLVKITGVGRMAVSSVVPEGFEGNTNQHLVVIKTKDFKTSEVLATFLNTDIGEKLASRRATGGTRPALDYSALKSIPIVFKPEIIETIKKAVAAKRAKEAQAQSLLDGIDAYLLERLGIETPAATEKKKTFFVRSSIIFGNRFDAPAYRQSFNYDSSKFPIEKLSKIAFINPRVTFEKLDSESEISFVPMEVINERDGAIEELRSKKVRETTGFTRFQENDLIWAKITPCMQNGKSAVARNLKQGFACGSTEFYVIRPRTKDVSVDYLHFLLRNKRVLENAQNFFGGSAGQQRVSVDFLKNFRVPVPPIEIQDEIAAHIQSLRERARELEREARAEVERARAEVEQMILGEASVDA
ncbi:MAG TPA: restriction endonuclease subunit S [Pyrinomonadaceae bacterium]